MHTLTFKNKEKITNTSILNPDATGHPSPTSPTLRNRALDPPPARRKILDFKNLYPDNIIDKCRESQCKTVANFISNHDSEMDSICHSSESEFVANAEISETIFQGYGEESFRNPSTLDVAVPEPFKRKIRDFLWKVFEESKPDEDGFVPCNSIYENLSTNYGITLPWGKPHKDQKIEFDMLCEEIYKEIEDRPHQNEVTPCLNESKICTLQVSKNVLDTFGLFSENEMQKQFEFDIIGNRRSTMMPISRIFSPVFQSQSEEFSPIKPPPSLSNENEWRRRGLENSYDDTEITWGTFEADANETTIDPVELRNEILELTCTNRKLSSEKKNLQRQCSSAEHNQLVLEEKCKELEEAISVAKEKLDKLRQFEEENLILKEKLEQKIESNCILQNSLDMCQQDKENLLKNIDSLKEEVLLVKKQLEDVAEEKEELNHKIANYLKEIELLVEEILSKNVILSKTSSELSQLQSEKSELEDLVKVLKYENDNLRSEVRKFQEKELNCSPTGNLQNQLLHADNSTDESSDDVKLPSEGSFFASHSNTPENSATSRQTTINEEIRLMEIRLDATSALPFCEKQTVQTFDSSSRSNQTDLQKAISRCRRWNNQIMKIVGDMVCQGCFDQDYLRLMNEYADDLRTVCQKGDTIIDIEVQCKISPRRLSISEEFSSCSSLTENSRERDRSLTETFIAAERCLLTPSKKESPKPLTDSSRALQHLESNRSINDASPKSGLPDMYLKNSVESCIRGDSQDEDSSNKDFELIHSQPLNNETTHVTSENQSNESKDVNSESDILSIYEPKRLSLIHQPSPSPEKPPTQKIFYVLFFILLVLLLASLFLCALLWNVILFSFPAYVAYLRECDGIFDSWSPYLRIRFIGSAPF